MRVQDLIAEFRRVTTDTVFPYHWDDSEVVSYIHDAVNEACERALLIEDSTTAAVCNIALEAGEASYTLHDSVIDITRAKLGTQKLTETSVEFLDLDSTTWEEREGEPRQFYCVGLTGIRVVPIPTEAATLSLTVHRRPIDPIDIDTDLSAILPAHLHLRLLPWVYRCAYLKADSEVFDATTAAAREVEFERNFGFRHDANVQRKQRDKRPPVVRAVW